MRISRLALATAVCVPVSIPAPLAARPTVQSAQPVACTAITQQDLQKARPDTVQDVVGKLPAPGTASPGCPSPQGQSPAPVQLTPWDQRILDLQNAERAAVGAPPLKWNPQLAADATAWAEELKRTGQLVHAPREGRGIERENLQKGLVGWGPDRMMQDWIGEKRYFKPGIYPDVCDGDWTQCAHYTQIIWVATIDIGCGRSMDIVFVYEVCRYSPGGNKDGKPVGEARASLAVAQNWGAQSVKQQLEDSQPTKVEQPNLIGQPEVFQQNNTGNASTSGSDLDDIFITFNDVSGPRWNGNFLVLSNSVDADADLDTVTFYDPAFAEDIGANALFQDIGVINFASTFGGFVDVDRDWDSYLLTRDAPSQDRSLGDAIQPEAGDTKVEPPTLPKEEVFKANAKVATSGMQEPSNPNQCWGASYWTAEDSYKDAMAKGDAAGMAAAKAQMAAAIGRQYQAAEASTEAGEMVSVSRYSLGDLLGKMMDGYKELTGEDPPGYYDPPNGFELAEPNCKTSVEQPSLPGVAPAPPPPEPLPDPM